MRRLIGNFADNSVSLVKLDPDVVPCLKTNLDSVLAAELGVDEGLGAVFGMGVIFPVMLILIVVMQGRFNQHQIDLS